MVTPNHLVMHCMNILTLGLISRSKQYEPIQFVTQGSDCRCLGAIWQFESSLLPCQSVFPVNSVSIHKRFKLPVQTYNLNTSTSLPLENGQWCFIDHWTIQFSYFGHCYEFNFAMCAFVSQCLPSALVPCSDGWQTASWQTIHMMPGLPVSSIPQWK
jgi:hypothetical protein